MKNENEYLVKGKAISFEGVLKNTDRRCLIKTTMDLFNILRKDNYDIYFVLPLLKNNPDLELGYTTLDILNQPITSLTESTNISCKSIIDQINNGPLVQDELNYTFREYIDDENTGTHTKSFMGHIVVLHDKDTDFMYPVPNGGRVPSVDDTEEKRNDTGLLQVLLDWETSKKNKWLLSINDQSFSNINVAHLNVGTWVSNPYNTTEAKNLKSETLRMVINKRENDPQLRQKNGEYYYEAKHAYTMMVNEEIFSERINRAYTFKDSQYFSPFMKLKSQFNFQYKDDILDIDMKPLNGYDQLIKVMEDDISLGDKISKINHSDHDLPSDQYEFKPIEMAQKIDKNEHYEPLTMTFKAHARHKNSNQLIRQISEVGNPFNIFVDKDIPESVKNKKPLKNVDEKAKELKNINALGEKEKIRFKITQNTGGYGSRGYSYIVNFTGAYADIVAFLASDDVHKFYSEGDFISMVFSKYNYTQKNNTQIYIDYTTIELHVTSQNMNDAGLVYPHKQFIKKGDVQTSYNKGNIIYRDGIVPFNDINKESDITIESMYSKERAHSYNNFMTHEYKLGDLNDDVTEKEKLEFKPFRELLENI